MAKVSISLAWDESRTVLARDGKLIASVALALLVLPGVVVNVLFPRSASLGMPEGSAWMIALLVALLITFAGQLSIVRLAMAPHLTVGEAIRHGAQRALPFVGAFLIWVVPFVIVLSLLYEVMRKNVAQPPMAAALGIIAIAIFALFMVVRLVLIGPVAAAERSGPVMILRRSWDLTAGNWWRLFGFLLVYAVGAIALIWAVASVVGVVARLTIGDLGPGSVGGLVFVLVAQILTAAVYAVLFVMQARIYVQLARNGDAQAGTPSSGT
jgi:hypothetical protein